MDSVPTVSEGYVEVYNSCVKQNFKYNFVQAKEDGIQYTIQEQKQKTIFSSFLNHVTSILMYTWRKIMLNGEHEANSVDRS